MGAAGPLRRPSRQPPRRHRTLQPPPPQPPPRRQHQLRTQPSALRMSAATSSSDRYISSQLEKMTSYDPGGHSSDVTSATVNSTLGRWPLRRLRWWWCDGGGDVMVVVRC